MLKYYFDIIIHGIKLLANKLVKRKVLKPEELLIAEKINHAIKCYRSNLPSKQKHRKIPVQIVIGATASGKTSCLSSHKQITPINSNAQVNQANQITATRDIACYISKNCIVIEIAGYELEQVLTQPNRLVTTLKSFKGLRLFSVLMMVTATEIKANTNWHALANFTKKLTENCKHLIRVDLCVTKLDLLTGFEQYANASIVDKESAVFGLGGLPHMTIEKLQQALQQQLENIMQSRLQVVKQQLSLDKRVEAFFFPEKLKCLSGFISDGVKQLQASFASTNCMLDNCWMLANTNGQQQYFQHSAIAGWLHNRRDKFTYLGWRGKIKQQQTLICKLSLAVMLLLVLGNSLLNVNKIFIWRRQASNLRFHMETNYYQTVMFYNSYKPLIKQQSKLRVSLLKQILYKPAEQSLNRELWYMFNKSILPELTQKIIHSLQVNKHYNLSDKLAVLLTYKLIIDPSLWNSMPSPTQGFSKQIMRYAVQNLLSNVQTPDNKTKWLDTYFILIQQLPTEHLTACTQCMRSNILSIKRNVLQKHGLKARYIAWYDLLLKSYSLKTVNWSGLLNNNMQHKHQLVSWHSNAPLPTIFAAWQSNKFSANNLVVLDNIMFANDDSRHKQQPLLSDSMLKSLYAWHHHQAWLRFLVNSTPLAMTKISIKQLPWLLANYNLAVKNQAKTNWRLPAYSKTQSDKPILQAKLKSLLENFASIIGAEQLNDSAKSAWEYLSANNRVWQPVRLQINNYALSIRQPELRRAITKWFSTLLNNLQWQLQIKAQRYIEQQWHNQIISKYTAAVMSKFPLQHNSNQVSDGELLAQLLNPNAGELDKFYKQYLQKIYAQQQSITFLKKYKSLRDWQKLLYSNKTMKPIRFWFYPKPAKSVATIYLKLNNTHWVYRNGPQYWQQIKINNPMNSIDIDADSFFSVITASGHNKTIVHSTGPWAWLRVLLSGHPQQLGQHEYSLRWHIVIHHHHQMLQVLVRMPASSDFLAIMLK